MYVLAYGHQNPALEMHKQDVWPSCDLATLAMSPPGIAADVVADVIAVARFWFETRRNKLVHSIDVGQHL